MAMFNMEFDQEGLPLIMRALHFAAEKHRRQRRKDAGGSPYINHPIAVAQLLCSIGQVRDATTIVSGILHDTIEDTETTGEELEKEFGPEVRHIVEEVTDDKSLSATERKRLQIERAAHVSTPAKLVKLADKICNVHDVIDSPPVGWSPERRCRYVLEARAMVDRLRGANPALEQRFDELCTAALELLGDDSCA